MRKKWDLPPEQGGALAILGIAFLLGGTAGCLFAAVSNGAGVRELSDYLSGYLTLAGEGELSRSLWPVLWGELKYPLAAVVLCVTALGAVGLPVIFGVRGFFFSFQSACFFRVFGARGLFPAFALFGLPALLWAPALFLAGTPGFISARKLLRRSLGEERGGSPLLDGACWYRVGLCVGLGLAAGLLEFWVVPVLLQAAARVVL